MVFGFDQGERNVGAIAEQIVGTFRFATRVQLATDNDAALGEGHLFPNLGLQVPTSLGDGGCDELSANVSFGEGLFHGQKLEVVNPARLRLRLIRHCHRRSDRALTLWLDLVLT